MNRVNKALVLLVSAFLLSPVAAFSQARPLAKTGFVDLGRIVREYAVRFFDGEIAKRAKSLELLLEYKHPVEPRSADETRETAGKMIRENRKALASLGRDKKHLERTGELRGDRFAEIVEKNILNAVGKTAELEGFSVVLDARSNFVYGSPEVDITDKVIARLLRGASEAAQDE